MTNNATKPLGKPSIADRIKNAEKFAVDAPKKEDPPKAPSPAVKKGKAPKSPLVRLNFECDSTLRQDVTVFVAKSAKFNTIRDFITQCIQDGLKKYEGK